MFYLRYLLFLLLFPPFLLAQYAFTYIPYDQSDKAHWYETQYGLTTAHVKEYVIKTKVYAAGWSKNGKFAYALQLPNEAKDTESGVFIIQDMVTDKVVEKVQWEFTPPKGAKETDFYAYMRPPARKIRQLLRKYHIAASKSTLMHFPIGGVGKPSALDAKLYMTWVNQPELFSEEEKVLTHFSLKLLKTEDYRTIKRKVLYARKDLLQFRYLDTFVGGYLNSPFEARIAIVLVLIQRGWEGPPHLFHVKFVGASLSKGF
jgi:hypothetical protein